jgi:hypothetical protein
MDKFFASWLSKSDDLCMFKVLIFQCSRGLVCS